MNWGHKIGLVYVGFVVFMLTLVVLCIKQPDINLVTDDYYQDELNYESKIQKMKNANNLTQKVDISFKDEVDSLSLNLTPASKGAIGTVYFYRPSNPKMDFRIPVILDENGTQKIFTGNYSEGLWMVKVDWSKEGKDYYKEEKIQI
jgi:hypothetical protein